MSEAKHTRGPWYYRKGDEWSHSVVTRHGDLPDGSPNYWTVASINKQREPEHEANAHLMAAAPDLFLALVMITDTIGFQFVGELEQSLARAAIAKATGQKQ